MLRPLFLGPYLLLSSCRYRVWSTLEAEGVSYSGSSSSQISNKKHQSVTGQKLKKVCLKITRDLYLFAFIDRQSLTILLQIGR